jgi:hypothetical protein
MKCVRGQEQKQDDNRAGSDIPPPKRAIVDKCSGLISAALNEVAKRRFKTPKISAVPPAVVSLVFPSYCTSRL